MKGREEREEDEKGLIWKLPVVKSKHLGKVGPAFGLGAGCGVGFGIGLLGGKKNKIPFIYLVSVTRYS